MEVTKSPACRRIDVPSRDAASHEFWIAARHRAGRPPRIGATVQSLDGLVEAIGAGLGVATAVPTAVDALGAAAGVVFRPVAGLEPVDFWVARRADDDRRQVLDFIAVAVATDPETIDDRRTKPSRP